MNNVEAIVTLGMFVAAPPLCVAAAIKTMLDYPAAKAAQAERRQRLALARLAELRAQPRVEPKPYKGGWIAHGLLAMFFMATGSPVLAIMSIVDKDKELK